jgi:group I intron endonuclease
MGYIYKVTNTINDKCYIGYTENPEARWVSHKKGAGSKRLHDAMKHYGKDKFIFEVIAEDSVDNENNYIVEHNAMHPNGYNLTEGGGLPPNKKGQSYEDIYGNGAEDQKKKRRQKQLDAGGYGPKEHTLETRQKISNALAGKNNPMYGRKHSEETKAKMRESLRLRKEQRV